MTTADKGVVLITGGNRGIGKELASQAVRNGYSVLITGRDAAQLDATSKLLRDLIPAGTTDQRVLGVQLDVRNEAECERVAELAAERFGGIYALVNNAGIGTLRDNPDRRKVPVWETPVSQWCNVMESNAYGPYYMIRAVLPRMLEGPGRRVINISTSRTTMERYVSYGASKAVLELLTRCLARDLAGTQVTANVLLPGGGTNTDFFPGEGDGLDRYPGITLLPVSIMNDAFLWLLSDASGSFSGRSIIGKLWDSSLDPAEAAKRATRELREEIMII